MVLRFYNERHTVGGNPILPDRRTSFFFALPHLDKVPSTRLPARSVHNGQDEFVQYLPGSEAQHGDPVEDRVYTRWKSRANESVHDNGITRKANRQIQRNAPRDITDKILANDPIPALTPSDIRLLYWRSISLQLEAKG
jgi:hypothetical protein